MSDAAAFNDRLVSHQIRTAYKRRYYTLAHNQTLKTMLFRMGREAGVAIIETTVAEIARQAGVGKTAVKEAIDMAIAAGHLIRRRTYIDGWFRGRWRRGYDANQYEFRAVDSAKMAELDRAWRHEIRPGRQGLEESVFLTVSLFPRACEEEEEADNAVGSGGLLVDPVSGSAPSGPLGEAGCLPGPAEPDPVVSGGPEADSLGRGVSAGDEEHPGRDPGDGPDQSEAVVLAAENPGQDGRRPGRVGRALAKNVDLLKARRRVIGQWLASGWKPVIDIFPPNQQPRRSG